MEPRTPRNCRNKIAEESEIKKKEEKKQRKGFPSPLVHYTEKGNLSGSMDWERGKSDSDIVAYFICCFFFSFCAFFLLFARYW
jgi:hypothetical protein